MWWGKWRRTRGTEPGVGAGREEAGILYDEVKKGGPPHGRCLWLALYQITAFDILFSLLRPIASNHSFPLLAHVDLLLVKLGWWGVGEGGDIVR